MVCRSRFPALATAALAAICLAAAVPAGAAVKKLLPLQFKEMDNLQDSYRSPATIGARSGQALFWAPLSLPVGSVITGMSYRHSGIGPGTPTSSVSIGYDITNDDPRWDPRSVGDGTSAVVTGDSTLNVVGGLTSGPHTVKANRRYQVTVVCAAGASVWQVDVTYNEP